MNKTVNCLAGILRAFKAGGPQRGVLVNSGEVLGLMGLKVDHLSSELRSKRPEVVASEIMESGFFDFEEEDFEEEEGLSSADSDPEAGEEEDSQEDESNKVFSGVGALGLDEGCLAAIERAGINTVEDLLSYRGDFTRINGIGPRRAAEIEAALSSHVGEAGE